MLVAAGCGGGGSRLTQAEFKAKTDAICAGYTKRAEQEIKADNDVDPTSPKATPLDIAKFSRLVEHGARLFGEQLADLRDVQPPAEAAARHSQVLRLYGQVDSALHRAARAARKGDRSGIGDLSKELDAVGRQVDALGFKCE